RVRSNRVVVVGPSFLGQMHMRFLMQPWSGENEFRQPGWGRFASLLCPNRSGHAFPAAVERSPSSPLCFPPTCVSSMRSLFCALAVVLARRLPGPAADLDARFGARVAALP